VRHGAPYAPARRCRTVAGTPPPPRPFPFGQQPKGTPMRGILAWLIGIPIPIIIILYFLDVF